MSMKKSTENSGFLDGREYTAAFLYEFCALLVGNGVYADELAPTATNDNMTITHGSGHAWINGVLYKNTTPFNLDIDTADGALNRYDSLMLRLDLSQNETYAVIVKGAFAASPTPPEVTRNAETFDLKICDIYIPAGCTKITQDLITDTRLDDSVCGVPVFPVEHLDMTTFYRQVATDLDNLRNKEQQEILELLKQLNNLVEGDTVGKLIAEIGKRLLKDGSEPMNGDMKMNSHRITGLGDPKENSDAVNLGTLNAAVRKAAPRNLLDNSDFRNPVNQRGRTTLTGAILDFIVDRWYISLDDGETAELTANGLSVSGDYHLQQRFVKGYLRSNAVYTSAIYYSDGSVELSNAPYLGESDFDYLSVSIKGNKTVACIALYEGEYTAKTLPDYQPKEYGVELAACMQYHYRSWTGTMNANGVLTRNAFNSSRMTSIDLPCAMRTTPTITIYADDGEINAVKNYVDGTKVAGVSVVYANNKSFIPAQQNGGFIAGAVYCFHYEASAEL